ncbi:MAG: 3D domain-containing protein [Blastocatellia bacterium]
MSNQFKQIVGIVGLSILLQFSAAAQGATSSASPSDSLQEKAIKSDSSSESSSLTNPDSSKVALMFDTKAMGEAKAEISSNPDIAIPKVSLQNPSLNLRVTARASKTNIRAFAEPNMESLGEPHAFQATAYALKGRTRMGTQVRRGVIAADPRVLPLGSVVQLRAGKYSGVYTVHDTGGKIRGNIIDVWVPDNREARQFGRQRIKLHVLRMGPQRRTPK